MGRGKALISVSDKSGVVELAKGLVNLGYEIVSTGGSFRALSEAGVAVSQVESITKFPEMRAYEIEFNGDESDKSMEEQLVDTIEKSLGRDLGEWEKPTNR